MKIRAVASFIETSRKKETHIRWQRICTRCGKFEYHNKISDIVLKPKIKKIKQEGDNLYENKF